MLDRWRKISSKIVHRNPWWTYMLDAFSIPNGVSGEYHYVHTEGSSMVVPITDTGQIILVKQYRFLCDRDSIEFPCGGVKSGKSYEEMARIELEEEAAVTSSQLEFAGSFNPFNGVTDEFCKVFIARELHPVISTRDTTEEFEILHHSPDEIDLLIKKNVIWDGMTLAAWMLAKPFITLEKQRS